MAVLFCNDYDIGVSINFFSQCLLEVSNARMEMTWSFTGNLFTAPATRKRETKRNSRFSPPPPDKKIKKVRSSNKEKDNHTSVFE